ncbi:MAG: nucleotidyl transferase AbiEii/AbiGii toxin family protein [Bacteroidales bacterium]|nr:nucleotidyl transferase AbiEii/AbiGii toxin family protein [Bacteroidales bacterium]
MIQLNYIENFFPDYIKANPLHKKYMLKEYLQLMILDFLSTSTYIRKIAFIGGTNLRLTKGIDRFSEDLDFDCSDFTEAEFNTMSNSVVKYLKRNGFNVVEKLPQDGKLKAFRSNIYFPELLFGLGLSGHKDERFLIKLESQNQHFEYKTKLTNIKGCGFFFAFPVPPDEVLCAMKISAMLSRQKGRDFYDVMFLLSQTVPDYNFLSSKCNISNLQDLKIAVSEMLKNVNLNNKKRDFEHLIFDKKSSEKVLKVADFFDSL